MAKKLTKAEIAKNPTKAINSGKMKMKKQEVPLSGIGKAAIKTVSKVLGKNTAKKTAIKKELEEFKADRVKQLGEWASHPGGASLKSNKRLVEKGKWSSPKQIAKYQKQEVKQGIKANARGLKAANKPVSKNNAGVGGPRMEAILKRATPARANRTRLGKSAFKSK